MKRADELLSAWAHDPRSLTGEERAEVEALLARSPELRREADDTRALLGRVRDLRDDGIEPAWDDFARRVRLGVAEIPPKRGVGEWLARWWKPTLGLGLAITAAGIVIAASRSETREGPSARREVDAGASRGDAGERVAEEQPAPDVEERFAFGSAGSLSAEELDAADLDDDVLEEIAAAFDGTDDDDDDETADALDVDDDTIAAAFGGDDDAIAAAFDAALADDGDALADALAGVGAGIAAVFGDGDEGDDAPVADGLVPDLDLAWIDELDDDEIDRVDAWLALETE